MTELRFRFPAEKCQRTLLKRAYFATWGRVPVRSHVSIEGNILTIAADIRGTGTVHVPFPHDRLGLIVQATDTIGERRQPFHLLKELARGSLGRILRRFFEWQLFGFRPVGRLKFGIEEAIKRFSLIATSDELDRETDEMAFEILETLDNLVLQMSEQYIEQSLSSRKRLHTKFPVPLGFEMNSNTALDSSLEFEPYASVLKGVFRTVNLGLSWREIEREPGVFDWDRLERRLFIASHGGFKAMLGPLIKFERKSLPLWVLDSLDVGGDITDYAVHYARSIVERFRYKVDSWIVGSDFNSQSDFYCPSLRAIQIVKEMAEAMRETGLTRPIFVGIDQPWGEYHLHTESYIPVVGVAESFLASKEIDGIILELNLGISARSTFPRDPMMLGTLIDQWSHLGKKLYVSLSIPSELGANPALIDEYISLSFDWTRKTQQEWVHRYIPMLISKRTLNGIIWNTLEDFPEGPVGENEGVLRHPTFSGLLDTKGKFKPAFRKITAIRNAHLE